MNEGYLDLVAAAQREGRAKENERKITIHKGCMASGDDTRSMFTEKSDRN